MIYTYFEMLKLTYDYRYFNIKKYMVVSPLIGITMRLEIETDRFYLGRHYSEALEFFGAVPIHISLIPDRKYISELICKLDGVLLPGSDSDIDPYIYQEEPISRLKKVVPEKDKTDLMVLEEAEKLKMPVFGICFGMQALNVYYGGSLIQDIETHIENPLKHEQGIPLSRLSHKITIKSKSKLAYITGDKTNDSEVKVNSHHHQSVKNVGKNLSASAWANDEVIECIESVDKDRFLLGVQWHPEIGFKENDISKKLFNSFVDECRIYSEFKGKICV